jgi:UDP-N-acetylbacillosamine N-acetyltransferase
LRLRKFEIVGFIDDVNPKRAGEKFCGSQVFGPDSLEGFKKKGVGQFIVGVGDNESRLRIAKMGQSKGFNLVSAIHPSAVISSDSKIGKGAVVCALVAVNPGVALGENVILNTGASVDHDCVIEDGVHVGPGAHLGGVVQVRRGAWIGIGAILRDHIEIGHSSIIGAGSLVIDNIPSGVTAFGSPAKVIKKNV